MVMSKWVKREPKKKPSKYDSPLEKIAKIRGIEDVERFLYPTQDELHDPYLLKNIEDASNRIIKAISKNEKIAISMDCDTDGITSGVILYRYLKNYTDNIYYIYNERGEGHGITNQMKYIQYDTDLLIIVDSSSNEVEACKKIYEEMGIDIVILDHHSIEVVNPYVILVNPQQEDCQYVNKDISGAGLVFKLICVMEDTLGQIDPFEYIDLVAVGLYADVMRVDVLENRFMILHGLRNIRNTGLRKILQDANVNTEKINCTTIGFTIAPLINSVARLDRIKLAIDLLLEDDEVECFKILQEMKRINEERKERQKEIVKQYLKHIDDSKKVLIVLDDLASKGFNGLIAYQLAETYKRPAIVGRVHQGTIAGSFRSYGGFDFKSFLQGFGDIQAMGHPQAGGIVLKEELLNEFERYIEENMPEPSETEQTIVYDLEIRADEIHEYLDVIEEFNKLYGNGFPKVMVRVDGILVEEAQVIGKTAETVKIKTFDEVELIKFKVDRSFASELTVFDEISVVGELRLNEWYHHGLRKKIVTPQIMIEDYRVAS